MRKLILLGVLLALVAGCKRAVNVAANNQGKQQQQMQPNPQPEQQGNQPAIHAPANVVINPNQGGGGGGGAAQAVRKRVKRAVNEVNLGQLRTFIEAEIIDEQMPTRERLATALQREARNLYQDWADGVIEVTGTRRTNGIWAYTVEPQIGDEHYVVTRSNALGRMTSEQLKQALMGN
jgi:hypothetical protein